MDLASFSFWLRLLDDNTVWLQRDLDVATAPSGVAGTQLQQVMCIEFRKGDRLPMADAFSRTWIQLCGY